MVTKHRADLPVLCGCFPLAIYCTFGSVYMFMPLSHFTPGYPSPSPCPQVHSLHLHHYSCPAPRFFITIFFRFHIYTPNLFPLHSSFLERSLVKYLKSWGSCWDNIPPSQKGVNCSPHTDSELGAESFIRWIRAGFILAYSPSRSLMTHCSGALWSSPSFSWNLYSSLFGNYNYSIFGTHSSNVPQSPNLDN